MKKLLVALTSFAAISLMSCDKDTFTTEVAQFDKTSQVTTRAHVTAFAYVSSNQGVLGAYPIGAAIGNPGSVTGADSRMINVPYTDADGIVYDEKRNALYQVNRTDDVLVAISDIDEFSDGDMATPSAMGPSTFEQGREATFYNNKVVVADDVTPGRLASYHVNESQINDFRQHQLDFEVWGIQISDKDLWAVVDETNQLAMFKDFFKAKSGSLSATATVSIEGLVRTHGLNYDADADVMVLTDIGSAASAADGGLIVIWNFSSKFEDAINGSGMISMSDQIRIYGPASELGNPVDVAIDVDQGAIFVAEKANGKFLVFETPMASGDATPVVSTPFAGASAVVLDID